jgi:hypothetical protein
LQHKTTGYYAVTDDVVFGFRHSPNVGDATEFDDKATAETERCKFDSFSGAWMSVPVSA